MIAKEVWFWLIIVGIIILAVGILIIVFSEGNRTLAYITIAGGVLVLLAGIIYAVIKSTRKPIEVGEEDIQLRNQFTNTLGGTIQKYNTNVDRQMNEFVDKDYKNLIQENVKSQGRLVGSVGGGLARWAI